MSVGTYSHPLSRPGDWAVRVRGTGLPWVAMLTVVAAAALTVSGVSSLWVVLASSAATFSLGRAVARKEPTPGFAATLVKEIERARRHRHLLTVVRIDGLSADHADRALGPEVRLTDELFDEGGTYFVVMPEQNRHAANAWLSRLGRPDHDLADEDPTDMVATVAEFPTDGLTVGALLETLAGGSDPERCDPLEPPTVGADRPAPGPVSLEPGYERTKRALDLVLCAVLIPLVVPVLALCALAVAIDSRGPVVFSQMRTGRHGHRFKLYKFRTMVRDAEELKAELAHLNVLAPPDFKIPDDPRVTRVGRFLRKTSLDELPQLWNILRGDMSFVGPRPTSFSADTYDLWHTSRLEVRPGLTGLWQIRARGEVDFDERLRMDVEYIRNRSITNDLRIMAGTLASVARGSGQ